MSVSEAPGFYGKIPATGDFVQRRLGAEFVAAWDDWLQHATHFCRERLGEQWLDYYLRSGLWRFAFAPGVCGPQPMAGVLAPSVDSVGRYFPLVVAQPVPEVPAPLARAAGPQAWYEGVQTCVLEALQVRSVTLERFDESLARVQAWEALPAPQSGGDHVTFELRGFHDIGAHAARHAGDRIDGHLQPVSHWWTDGSERIGPTWIAVRGLPSPELFLHMLTGQAVATVAAQDQQLMAGLMGETVGDDRTPTRIDDSKADILGLFDIDS